MIAERIKLDLTPRQAELVLAALREDLSRADELISCRREESDNLRVRSIITAIKEQGIV
jgi:hypothetical protein